MSEMPMDFHGSDVELVADYFNVPREKMISFASNVNPMGISPKLRNELAGEIDCISRYPERDYRTLRQAIGRYTGADPAHIAVGNGSTELISGVISGVNARDAVLVSPSYSEYEREVGLHGGHLRYFMLSPEDNFTLDVDKLCRFFTDDTGLLIMCSPNNPTANAADHDTMRHILEETGKRGITVMVDETYIEFSEHMSDIDAFPLTSEYNNLVVIRGVSKFFASPGLRLGYAAMGSDKLLKVYESSKDPWTVNSLAAKAGEIMFSDSNYIHAVRAQTSKELKAMRSALTATGKIHVYPTESNFLLCRLHDTDINSTELFSRLASRGMMIRDCSSFDGLDDHYIRIAMMNPDDNRKLADAITEILTPVH